MRRRNLVVWLAAIFAVALILGSPERACAAGYWNVPGTHAQRAGHGFGGGYHAPLLLGPIRHDGWHLGAPVRLPYAPTPYYGCGGGCYGDYGQTLEATSSLDGLVPTQAPAAVPTPAVVPAPAAAAPEEAQPVEPVTPAEPVQPTSSETESLKSETVTTVSVEPAAESVKPLFGAPVQP